MMPGVYILVISGALLLRTLGPLPYSIEECSSKIELWTKLYLADPPLFGVRRHDITYQCIEKLRTPKRKRSAER